MAEVSLRRLSKSWGSVAVIRELDLTINDGEFLVLLGPSGCGKTTTMRMIAGLESVSGGEILVDGRPVANLPARERDIAMVFQNYGLYPHMTVADNIGYPLRLRGISGADRDARVRAAAERVHLGPYLDRKPRALSGGQRQRVALARAIVRTPRLFMLDEPLSNLDAKLRVSMRAELKHLHHELGTTTIYVTHDQIEAMTLATRVAVMDRGRIVQLDTPERIYNDPEEIFVAAFIGSPPMNFLAGRAGGGTLSGPGFRIGGAPPALEGEVTMGIRPEHVALAAVPESADIAGPAFTVEFTGQSTLVSVALGETLLTGTAPPDRQPEIGAPVGLNLDRARAYWFETASGKRIRP